MVNLRAILRFPSDFIVSLVGSITRRIEKAICDRRLRVAIKEGLQVGDDCSLSEDAYFGTKPYLVKIGNHVDLSSGAVFITHAGADFWLFEDTPEHAGMKYYDTIEIKDNCFIGVRVTFLPGVTVGPNSIVGAGSVVTRDVPPNTVVMGNPARPVCSVDIYKQLILRKSFRYSPETWQDRRKMREAVQQNLKQLHAQRLSALKTSGSGTTGPSRLQMVK